MALGFIDRPPSQASLDAARIGDCVTLLEPRRKARRHVRLYRDSDGRPFVRDRLHGRRYIVAVRFLTIDGQPLECGAVVLEGVE